MSESIVYIAIAFLIFFVGVAVLSAYPPLVCAWVVLWFTAPLWLGVLQHLMTNH